MNLARRGHVIGPDLCRQDAAARCPVMQEFHMRRRLGGRFERHHIDFAAGKPVEPILLRALIERASAEVKSEQTRVEGYASFHIHNRDGGVVVAENSLPGHPLPDRRADAVREGDQLQRVALGIAEFEGGDAAGAGGQEHRHTACDDARWVAIQSRRGHCDITADESEMLKPLIIRGALTRIRLPRRVDCRELDCLLVDRDIGGAHPGARLQAEQAVPGRIVQRLLGTDHESERVAVEGGHPRDVGDGETDADELRYRHVTLPT